MAILAVGSTNIVKVQAVEEAVKEYPLLADAKIVAIAASSEVSDQPLTLEETIRGAKNRARNAFIACGSCNYAFGIEGGLFEAAGTQTGFLHGCACCIYDGANYLIGLASSFEVPPPILDLILEKKMDLSQACYHSGITTSTSIGTAEGLIGILTNGRIDRKQYSKQSILSALVQLEHASWYSPVTKT